jgi:hypothetical protein
MCQLLLIKLSFRIDTIVLASVSSSTMPQDREYDLVLFGATGYTGKLTARHITTHLPTDLRWAVAGRSSAKLEAVIEAIKSLNPDRIQPGKQKQSCKIDNAAENLEMAS